MKKLGAILVILAIVISLFYLEPSKASYASGKKLKQGDVVKLGFYEQDGYTYDGSEPIEWEILSINDGKALLLSKYILDCKMYNEEHADVSWESCDLRKWLNGEFYNTAFSDEEKKMIVKTKLSNKDANWSFGNGAGNDTEDNVFLLSYDEALDSGLGFDEDASVDDIKRRCAPTQYARMAGVYDYEYAMTDENKASSYWWLRTSIGYTDEGYAHASTVFPDGRVDTDSYGGIFHAWVNRSFHGVRPAIWVDENVLESYKLDVNCGRPSQASIIDKNIKKDDILLFGSYEQDNNKKNGKELIEWHVLDVADGKALIVSKYTLDSKAYQANAENVTWESSDLRKWLNEDFYKTAFSDEERARITDTKLINQDNDTFEVDGGKDTTDKIFILSFDEVNKYKDAFWKTDENSINYISYATAYAIDQGIKIGKSLNCENWVRMPGEGNDSATYIMTDGGIDICGAMSWANMGVRPAMWINLEASGKTVEKTPSKPVIKVSATKKGIKVTINKTKQAEGYEIYAKGQGDKKYKLIATVEQDGTAKRSVMIKDLAAGKYSIKVRAYSGNKKGKFSKIKKIETK